MAPSPTRRRVAQVPATVVDASGSRRGSERLAGEEPLEIRVEGPLASASAARGAVAASAGDQPLGTTSTMRTPGQDFALAVGLLHGEGVIGSAGDVADVRYCTDAGDQQYNVVTVRLRREPRRPLAARSLPGTASCGVCGTASIDDLCDWAGPVASRLEIDAALLAELPARLRAVQPLFDETGGLHAAGLFDGRGRAVAVAEDIGRHNALDKAIGERLLEGGLPGDDLVAVLSSRVSFELVQKVAAAGVPIICAVSAPSNLAVATADRLGITLAAFVRDGRATLYTHPARVTGRAPA